MEELKEKINDDPVLLGDKHFCQSRVQEYNRTVSKSGFGYRPERDPVRNFAGRKREEGSHD